MATIQLYDHTIGKFVKGENSSSDTYKVMLCSAATFDATNTTLSGITKTQISASGYSAGGAALTSVTLDTVTTNDAAFDADDVVWTVGSGDLVAAYAILYNDTDPSNPPVAFFDFDGSRTVSAPNDFSIIWNPSGIILFSYT